MAARAEDALELVAALGGDDEVTPQQRRLIDQATMAAVIRDAAFQVRPGGVQPGEDRHELAEERDDDELQAQGDRQRAVQRHVDGQVQPAGIGTARREDTAGGK